MNTQPQSRLDASDKSRPHVKTKPVAGDTACLECCAPFARLAPHGDFCCAGCRRAFNNRRAQRGAELYDLFMALRYERETATALKVWKLLNRMAAHFRAQDRARRGGRKSWRPAENVILRRPWLRADILMHRKKKPDACNEKKSDRP